MERATQPQMDRPAARMPHVVLNLGPIALAIGALLTAVGRSGRSAIGVDGRVDPGGVQNKGPRP